MLPQHCYTNLAQICVKPTHEKKIEDLLDDNVPLGPVNQQIINGSSWDITKTITVENRALLLSELLIDELLRKRVSQLNAICDGLQVLGVLEFVR